MGVSSALGSSALLPAGLGFRNKIINGDFRINQRGFSSTTTNGTYGLDRWYFQTSTGTGTYSRQTFTTGSPVAPGLDSEAFARVVSASQTGSSALLIFSQKIEDVRNCAGSTVSISLYAKAASGNPKVAVELEQQFGSGGSPSANVTNYVGQVTLTTSWQLYTLTFNVPSISGKTIGTTANTSSLVLNLWCSAGTDYNARTGSLGVQNNTFDFWGVQVEQNYRPTPFEQRPIGVELALCQRYYEKSYDTDTAPNSNTNNGLVYFSGSTDNNGQIFYPVIFKVPKRSTNYQIAFNINTGASAGNWQYNRSGASANTAMTNYLPGNNGFIALSGNIGVGWVAANLVGHWACNAEL